MEALVISQECFWIFSHTGLGDHIVCNALYRHYADLHKDKFVIIPIWEHNLAAVQWTLSDVTNIFFYPIETEQQLLTCRDGVDYRNKLCLGFYEQPSEHFPHLHIAFNPVLWDSEFYRQANLDPLISWSSFKIPSLDNEGEKFRSFIIDGKEINHPYKVVHQDRERGFGITPFYEDAIYLDKTWSMESSCRAISLAYEIHAIDSCILCLSDRMETPYCKRFVFHRYARKGLPPRLKKNWEILD